MEAAYLEAMRMTVLASGSKGNSTVIASAQTHILVDAGLSCRELLKRMSLAGEDPAALDAILITHEHQDHVAGLATLARRLRIPVFLTEPTHRAWVRMVTPRTTMTYAQWLDQLAQEREQKQAAATVQPCAGATESQAGGPELSCGDPELSCGDPELSSGDPEEAAERVASTNESVPQRLNPDSKCSVYGTDKSVPLSKTSFSADPEAPEEEAAAKPDPAYLPVVEYFHSGTNFSIGDISITPFTIPHDAADPCGFVFESRAEAVRMAIATDLGYMPPNVKSALRRIDVLLLESNHDLEMLRDGPYPWAVKQRVLSRVGHLSNHATAEFLSTDYDGGATWIVLGHLSESNNVPELARISAEEAIGGRMSLLGNRILLAQQSAPLAPISL
jgi:phosphoribosyl 1,2-cyclic phosphodiesterase